MIEQDGFKTVVMVTAELIANSTKCTTQTWFFQVEVISTLDKV